MYVAVIYTTICHSDRVPGQESFQLVSNMLVLPQWLRQTRLPTLHAHNLIVDKWVRKLQRQPANLPKVTLHQSQQTYKTVWLSKLGCLQNLWAEFMKSHARKRVVLQLVNVEITYIESVLSCQIFFVTTGVQVQETKASEMNKTHKPSFISFQPSTIHLQFWFSTLLCDVATAPLLQRFTFIIDQAEGFMRVFYARCNSW